MPIIKRAFERKVDEEGRLVALLAVEQTRSGCCSVDLLTLPAGAQWELETDQDEIVWLHILSGSGRMSGSRVNETTTGLVFPGTTSTIEAEAALNVLMTRVPGASRFDANLAALNAGTRVVDWGREPVLQSEHDRRTRIYLTTPGLTGTAALKAELISYPPGTAAPEHHHEGAEHFQYVLSGSGVAVLEGVEHQLFAGDILFNHENERHYFYTSADAAEEFRFVECFIPGHCRTVWVQSAEACAWLPTGKTVQGGIPAREIGYHVHGDDAGI